MNRPLSALMLASSTVLGFLACSSEKESPPAGVVADDASAPETGGPAPGSAQSGSRLKIARLKAPGDIYAGPTLRDAELGPCVAAETADGTVRCVPMGSAGIAYADAACTVPLAGSPAGCASTYAVTDEPPSLDERSCALAVTKRLRAFEVGAPATATTVYTKIGDVCEAAPVPQGTALFAAKEIPPSRMVALERVDEAIGRVAVRLMTSADGLRLPLGLVDAASAKACSLARASDGQEPGLGESVPVACVPGAAALASPRAPEHADATCSSLAAVVTGPCASAPSFVEVASDLDPQCGTKKAYAVGPQLPGAFAGTPGACGPINGDPSRTLWSVGEPLPLAPFATVQRTMLGSQKLRSVAYVVDGKTVLDGFDATFVSGDARCNVVDVGGVTYCLPVDAAQLPEVIDGAAYPFADADCKLPARTNALPCKTKPSFFVTLTPPGACGARATMTQIYDVGAPAATLYVLSGGVCKAMGITPPDIAYFAVGAERRPEDVLVRLEPAEL